MQGKTFRYENSQAVPSHLNCDPVLLEGLSIQAKSTVG